MLQTKSVDPTSTTENRLPNRCTTAAPATGAEANVNVSTTIKVLPEVSTKEEREEVCPLFVPLSIMVRLATMDVEEYQAILRTASPPKATNPLRDAATTATTSSTTITSTAEDHQQHRLPNQQKNRHDSRQFDPRVLNEVEQKYENTPISALTQSIHALQSKITLLHQESDHQTSDIAALQQLVMELKRQNESLEQQVSDLTKKNQSLTKKLKRRVKEKKCLASHIKEFLRKAVVSEQQGKELEELKVAYKLQAHEHYLQVANRSRTTSADSNLSDGLDFMYPEGSADESESSSVISLITTEGVATTQLSPLYTPREFFASHEMSPVDMPLASPRSYTLHFDRGTKSGLRIRALPIEMMPATSPVVTNSTLKPNMELTRALMATNENPISDTNNNAITSVSSSFNNHCPADEIEKSSSHRQGHNPFAGLNLKMNIFNTNNSSINHNKSTGSGRDHEKGNHQGTTEVKGHIFVVTGYGDFDPTRNITPPLGARIVAINGVSIPDNCTLQDITDSLDASGAGNLCDNDGSTYSITFRNDPLTARQKELLRDDTEVAAFLQDPSNVTPCSGKGEFGTSPGETEKDNGCDSEVNDNPTTAKPSLDGKHMTFNFAFMQRSGTHDLSKTNSSSNDTEDKDDAPAVEATQTKPQQTQRLPNVFQPFWKSKVPKKGDTNAEAEDNTDDSLL